MKSSTQPRILIVEDEPHIAEGLKLNLGLQGYAVKIAMDAYPESRPVSVLLGSD